MFVSPQLSGGAPTEPASSQPDISSARLTAAEGEVERLSGDVRQLMLERDQAYSDLSALRESLVDQHDSQTKKVIIQVHVLRSYSNFNQNFSHF